MGTVRYAPTNRKILNLHCLIELISTKYLLFKVFFYVMR